MGKVDFIPIEVVQGIPARDPYWGQYVEAKAYEMVKRKIESPFPKNQASVRPPQTTVDS
jgi:hypothetical protein